MDIALIAIIMAIIAVVMYGLSKLKLLSTVAIIFLAVMLTFLVMVFVPALQVEPVYSVLKSVFEALPTWLGSFAGAIGKMLGGLV